MVRPASCPASGIAVRAVSLFGFPPNSRFKRPIAFPLETGWLYSVPPGPASPPLGNGGGPADLPRRPRQSIPLLPSGPGVVFDLSLRSANGATMYVRLTTAGEPAMIA